jgi:hypothetical protein
MREIFTYGSVGGAPGNRCFYPEIGVRYNFVGNSAGLAKYIEITISGMENMPQFLN